MKYNAMNIRRKYIVSFISCLNQGGGQEKYKYMQTIYYWLGSSSYLFIEYDWSMRGSREGRGGGQKVQPPAKFKFTLFNY